MIKSDSVIKQFLNICNVPRPSKHEEKIRAFIVQFAVDHNLEYKEDSIGNIVIFKPATPGFENRKTVVLQSHMDMVPDKLASVEHDFLVDPIKTEIVDGWLTAKGTTLGADNGIGCAAELALLESDSIEHGPLVCLFTVDEETGLTGAFELKEGFFEGDYLLNLDSEDEGQIFIGCAGGCRTNASFKYSLEAPDAGSFFMRMSISGLAGGHSGDDIDKMHANAIKLLSRFLYASLEKYDLRLAYIEGGKLHNAIPRTAEAVFAVPSKYKESLRADLNVFISNVEEEYSKTEKNISICLESTDEHKVFDAVANRSVITALQSVFNGVFAMSQDIEGLVETSSNLASVRTNESVIEVVTSQRSSILSARTNVSNSVKAAFEQAGADVLVNDGYPGWKPNPNSEILRVAVDSYRRLFGKEPLIKAIHAGLECGLFLEKYPNLDMISFGPTLRCVHTPDEKMELASVDLFWTHLIDILKNIPLK